MRLVVCSAEVGTVYGGCIYKTQGPIEPGVWGPANGVLQIMRRAGKALSDLPKGLHLLAGDESICGRIGGKKLNQIHIWE